LLFVANCCDEIKNQSECSTEGVPVKPRPRGLVFSERRGIVRLVVEYRKPWIIRTPYDACPTVKLLRTVL